MPKVLWVDWDDIFWYMESTIEALEREGIGVAKLTWYNPTIGGWDFDCVVSASQGMDIVILHFGNIPFGQAQRCLSEIKAAGAKTIAISVGRLLPVDGVICKPFLSSELVNLIRKLAR